MIKIFTLAMRGAGLLALLAALIQYTSDGIVEYSMSKSQGIEEIFQVAANKVYEFKVDNGRFPNTNEFELWNDELSKYGLYGELMEYHIGTYPDEALSEFGSPRENGFVLGVWRGEWREYYSSWSKNSTLPTAKSNYYMTGSGLTDMLSLSSLAIFLFGLAHHLARKSRITNGSRPGTLQSVAP